MFRLVTAALVFSTVLLDSAQADWTVVRLGTNCFRSFGMGTHGGSHVGHATNNDATHAILWTNESQLCTSLHPAGASESWANGASDELQVGWIRVLSVYRAGVWSGTPESWISIHPMEQSIRDSFALRVWNNQQVGYVTTFSNFDRASLWFGTSDSWRSLHPDGYWGSRAFNLDGEQQVGWVSDSFSRRAALWSGHAASFIDLHPEGASESAASAVFAGTQVGFATFDGNSKACMWHGSDSSYQNINPPGASGSVAWSTFNGKQAGWAYVGLSGFARACIWSGSAESWEDISLALPGQWFNSFALDVWDDGTTLFVVGMGTPVSPNSAWPEALLWTRPVNDVGCDRIDFNNDGSLFDPSDIDVFLSVFSEGPCIPSTAICNDIDFYNDGSVFDPCDIDSFLLVFSEGPCTPCGT